MTAHPNDVTLNPEQQKRADRFVQLLITTRTILGGARPASRRSLALQLALSPTMLNRYEAGDVDPAEVRFGVIANLAQVLGVSLAAVGMYLLHGKTRGLLEHQAIAPVAHLLEVVPGATDADPAWISSLKQASPIHQANTALRLMQQVAVRMIDLGGASAGRETLLDRMSLDLPTRQKAKVRRTFEQQLVGLMTGQLLTEPAFWTAIAPALADGGTPETLLADLGAITPED